MQLENVAAKRSKSHQKYMVNGVLVPGVTTVLGVLAKPALVPWANNLGLQGIKVGNYVDVLALVGTTGHDMICCHLENRKFDPGDLSPDLIDKAENCFLSYLTWEKQHKVEPILCEAQLVSSTHRFGGTIDFYGKIDGVLTLKDFKTGKAIYDEMLYQVAAYKQLIMEAGHQVDAVGILQIGRDETEGFSERVISDCSKEWEIFLHALSIYNLRKKNG